MQFTRPLALALLLTGACASTPGNRGSQQEEAKQPLRGGVAEFRLTSYDGRDLKGRVLLGAMIDSLVIDGRMVEEKDVELKEVRACGKKERLGHYRMESLTPPRPDEIVTVRRGYWYGANVDFFLWDKETGPGPDCFEAELVLSVRGGAVAARLPIRVERTDKPSALPDGGTEPPKPPPSDGGAP
jgi:hypothetical protein